MGPSERYLCVRALLHGLSFLSPFEAGHVQVPPHSEAGVPAGARARVAGVFPRRASKACQKAGAKPDETIAKACFPSHTVHPAFAWKPTFSVVQDG